MTSPTKITEILSSIKSNWTSYFRREIVESISRELGHKWRERKLNPAHTLELFLLQILHGNTACNHVRYFSELNFSAVSYCKSRSKLPLELFELLLSRTVCEMKKASPTENTWQGHRILLADGTGCSMPDTAELQSYFGQPGGQRKGCGFPVAHLLGLVDFGTGMFQELIISPLSSSDISGASKLGSVMQEGDIAVYDRGFCSSAHVFMLSEKYEVHSVMRVPTRSYKVDFRESREHEDTGVRRYRVAKLGAKDQLIVWGKSANKPSWMTEDEYDSLPEEKVVREISYSLDRKGFRSQKIVLVTTLLDSVKYPAERIAELYGIRWEIEIDFRHLKQTLGMDSLKCKTVEGVKKELYVYILVYNLIRQAMIQRSKEHDIPVSRISFVDTIRWLIETKGESKATPVINPQRPGRSVPRVVKKRPKAFPRMTKKRKISLGKVPKKQIVMA